DHREGALAVRAWFAPRLNAFDARLGVAVQAMVVNRAEEPHSLARGEVAAVFFVHFQARDQVERSMRGGIDRNDRGDHIAGLHGLKWSDTNVHRHPEFE